MLRACETEFERTLFLAAYYTGMRLGKLQALLWSEVHFARGKHGLIVVKRSWSRGAQTTPKSRKARTLLMGPKLAQALERHSLRTHYGAENDRVFAHPESGKVLDEGWIRKRFLKAQRRAGVGVTRLHDTRATFATILWSQGRSLASIQSKLGHADPRTTIGYIKGYHGQDDESEIIEMALAGHSIEPVAA